jgi:hypothetical protein
VPRDSISLPLIFFYHFFTFWRLSRRKARHSRPRPSYLGFQASRGAHHSVEEFRSTGFERDFGDLGTWVVLTVARSISWHISWGDWTLLAAGLNC